MELLKESREILNNYSNHLDKLANEGQAEKLNDCVKRFIASRILGKSSRPTTDIALEHSFNTKLHENIEKLIASLSEDESSRKLSELLNHSYENPSESLSDLKNILKDIDYEGEIDLGLVLDPYKDEPLDGSSNDLATSKARGRPKKQIVMANNQQIDRLRAKRSNIVYITLSRQLMINYSRYLAGTNGRILVKGESLGSKAPKNVSSSTMVPIIDDDLKVPPAKKLKRECRPCARTSTSPLDSEESRLTDASLISNLELVVGLQSIIDNSIAMSGLRSNLNPMRPGASSRYTLDSLLIVESKSNSVEPIESFKECCDKLDGVGPEQDLRHIRALVQLVSFCHAHSKVQETFKSIDLLIKKMREFGLLVTDDSYVKGDSINEYKMFGGTVEKFKLEFLFFDQLSIMRYCISILMKTLEKHILADKDVPEIALGHTIALSQFDWPKNAKIYKRCIQWIRDNKPTSTTPQCTSESTKFTYSEFFNHVQNPHIIEDFMALLCQGYTLDIKVGAGSQSSSTRASSTRSGKAITTRGTNKTFKEDLKVAMISQMRNSSLLVPLDTNAQFIQNSLLPYLMQINT